MKKMAALSAFLVFAVGSAALAVGDVSSFAKARALAAELNKPLLVEFYTEW